MPDSNELKQSTEKNLQQAVSEQMGQQAQEDGGVDDSVPTDELQKKRQELQNGQSDANESDDTQDANDEQSKYDDMLKNTWGLKEDQITPEIRKLAKSYVSIQKTATQSQQEAKQSKELAGKFNSLLENNPDFKQHAQAILNGQQYENPTQRKPSNGQSNNKGELDEQELITQGYLTQEELAGLDELAKQSRITQAQMRAGKDKMLSDFEQELKNKREALNKQDELKSIKDINSQRLGQSFDRFVQQTGFDLVNLDQEVFDEIQKGAAFDRDPSDPRKVKEDAFESAAMRVLQRHGLLDKTNMASQSKRNIDLDDTGASVKNSQRQTSKKTLNEQLEERENKAFHNRSFDPKQKYTQQI